jgi:hypothetical protein
MSKPVWSGLALLACGAVLGFVLGGMVGLLLASLCLVIGLVLMVASEALGTKWKPVDSQIPLQSKTPLLVLLKEVHARPHRNGRFQQIRESNQNDLQFEVFAHCWLVNDTDQVMGLVDARISLSTPGTSAVALEKVPGDLGNWRLGRLRDELDSWGVRYLQAAQEPMIELSLGEPLEGGGTREGWLHLRGQNLTPAQMKNATIELEVIDSQLQSHIGRASGPHQVPGRVWPFQLQPTKASNVVFESDSGAPSASPS